MRGLRTDWEGHLWAGTWTSWLARIDPERGVVVSALCLNASVAQYPIMDMDSDDAGLLWVATHGGGFICVDPERARCYGLRHSDGRRPVSPPWWRA